MTIILEQNEEIYVIIHVLIIGFYYLISLLAHFHTTRLDVVEMWNFVSGMKQCLLYI
jgi:hypothetical protein